MQIRIVVAEPGKEPEIRLSENTAEAFQKIVGGYIEGVYPEAFRAHGLHLYVNEEGKIRGLQPNRQIPGDTLVGPIIVSKGDDEGDDIGLTEAEAHNAIDLVKAMPMPLARIATKRVPRSDVNEFGMPVWPGTGTPRRSR